MKCPECGAANIGEITCEARYHECLVLEFTAAGFGSVHHLTVTAYMLQHSSKLTRQGWLETRRLLKEFLIEHKPPAEIRRRNKDDVNSGKRNWKIASKDGIAKISRTEWTKTILDVRLRDAKAYCKDVAAWAQAALMDSDGIAEPHFS